MLRDNNKDGEKEYGKNDNCSRSCNNVCYDCYD